MGSHGGVEDGERSVITCKLILHYLSFSSFFLHFSSALTFFPCIHLNLYRVYDLDFVSEFALKWKSLKSVSNGPRFHRFSRSSWCTY